MKKFFMCAMAVAATMSLTSCLSEDEVNLEKGNMGTISVNVTADDQLATRANAELGTPSTWYAYVAQSGTAKFGTSSTPRAISELSGFGFAAGDGYTLNVYSHESQDAAMPNGALGNAYYTGTQKTKSGDALANYSFADLASFSIVAGQPTSVDVYCGKAQNARLSITNAEFAGTITSVTAVAHMTDGTTARNVTFGTVTNTESTTTQGYFHAGEVVSVTINYNIYSFTDKSVTHDFTVGAAGTNNVLNIKSNSNGTITIANIYYDDEWTEGRTEEITINAATGNKLTE